MDKPSGLSKEHLIADLFLLEARLGKQLTSIDCRFIKSPARIRAHLESMPEDCLLSLKTNLSNFSHILDVAKEEDVEPWDDAALLILAMRAAGLMFPNDLLDVVGTNNVIEAYDMNRRQIFRNLHFLEVTSYSLLELLSYDWPMLFHRNTDITNILIRQSEQDMWAANDILRAEVPTHHVCELLCENPQISEVQQLYLAPLFGGPNKPGGVLAITSVRPIGPVNSVDRENLAFIR